MPGVERVPEPDYQDKIFGQRTILLFAERVLLLSLNHRRMKNFFGLLGLLIFGSSCEETPWTDTLCADGPIAKTVADATGIVSFDSTFNAWLILVSIEGTYDAQDVGILCEELPEEVREVGKRVRFEGAYQTYTGNRRPPIAGQTYYHLAVADIESAD